MFKKETEEKPLEDLPTLRKRALDILARQEISRKSLAQKLRPYAQNLNDLNTLLDELEESHRQSDSRFAEVYIHSKSKRQGNMRLKQGLMQKGLSGETFKDLLPTKQEEQAAACEVLRKKFKQPPKDPIERLKHMRFLAYRGFGAGAVRLAMQEAWRDDDESYDDGDGK